MKGVFIAISVLAIANLLGVIGFVGWLYQSGRLDRERVDRIRAVLGETIAEEKVRVAAEKAKAEEEAKKEAAEARLRGDPETAGAALVRQREKSEVQEATIMRLRQELTQLTAEMAASREAIDRDRSDLDAKTKALAAKTNKAQDAKKAEQFKQTLGALEAQKPALARQALQAMLDQGRRDQVLEYLAAMQEDTRAKLVTEFIKTDERLAADLLQGLLTRGTAPAGSSTPPAGGGGGGGGAGGAGGSAGGGGGGGG
jgi:hypothetical protein